MARKRLIQISLLLLLSSSCAWANGGSRHGEQQQPRGETVPRGVGEARSEPVSLWWTLSSEEVKREEGSRENSHHRPRRQQDDASPAHLAARAPLAQITPAPVLRRQDDGQIAQLSAQIRSISDASRQVSQASQQLSQSSQQLSQSLQQVQQQLSQTQQQLASARADADAASRGAESARQDRDQASRSADAAVLSAQSSASQAMASAVASATSSAGASAAGIIAAASVSAQSIMDTAASMVQAAKADATAVRAEADNKILQAQGTAVSVTQAAVAVVGATVGSSLLTIGAVVLVLRYKRNRKRRRSALSRRATTIGYPAFAGSSSGANYYEPGAYETRAGDGFGADVKEPLPTAVPAASRVSVAPTAIGYATSGSPGGDGGAGFHLRTPPRGKFTLFPRDKDEFLAGGSRGTSPDGGGGGDDDTAGPGEKRVSKFLPPSLDTWLRAGTVSPFGAISKNSPSPGKAQNWPLSRPG
ncbi:hypothetical protein QBC33DRAFT_510217 [Phialemonium atrogriseum]|uniref:Uncharacterized protein n=1 Tax=Phialemonium atrogriseum TaxID=1093897 RepID=A0AAJ0C8X5_9PEZI|nr:uncharacterized protein QBC33DRAFT_510217 [Phialemonium atrogriseum]KAK1772343.1 hypothetical protein QBC33DRAFT_510217 [Phialemonium atrogriseum]